MDTTRTLTVGRKRKQEPNDQRVDLRTTLEWLERAEDAARLKGLTLSSYIRMAVLDRMNADGIPIPAHKPRPRKPD